MLSIVTLNCHVTMIDLNSGSQLSEMSTISHKLTFMCVICFYNLPLIATTGIEVKFIEGVIRAGVDIFHYIGWTMAWCSWIMRRCGTLQYVSWIMTRFVWYGYQTMVWCSWTMTRCGTLQYVCWIMTRFALLAS